jgi:hypothetical protein
MKKQNLTRVFLMAAMLVGVLVAAGNAVYAQSGGFLGSGGRSQYLGSGGRDSQIVGSGARADGGLIGSGTFSDGGGVIGSGNVAPEDDGGLIGSGTRSQTVGSGGRTSSFFDTMMRFFGF